MEGLQFSVCVGIILTRGLRQMQGNIGEYIIFITPIELNMFNNTPIIIDEIGKVKNQQSYCNL